MHEVTEPDTGGEGRLRLVPSGTGALGPGELGPFARLLPTKKSVTGNLTLTLLGLGDLPVRNQSQKLFLGGYPLIEAIPRLDAQMLSRIDRQRPGHVEAQAFLLARLEANRDQARWYVDWCRAFGVPEPALRESRPAAAMEAIVHYLWSVAARETLAVGLASLHVGAEWALGQWAARMRQGVDYYLKSRRVYASPRVLEWLRTQRYGPDLHRRAMAIIKGCCESPAELERAIDAVERTIDYFVMFLDEAMNPPFPRWADG